MTNKETVEMTRRKGEGKQMRLICPYFAQFDRT